MADDHVVVVEDVVVVADVVVVDVVVVHVVVVSFARHQLLLNAKPSTAAPGNGVFRICWGGGGRGSYY